MGRIFNVLVPAIVLSAFFQDGSGSFSSGDSFGPLTVRSGFNSAAAGNGVFAGQAENSGANGGPSWSSGTGGSSGTGNAYGSMTTENSMANDGSVNGGGYNRGTGNSASSWNTGYYENSAAYDSGSATSNGLHSNFGNGGGSAYNGGSNAHYGSNAVYGGNGETIQYDSHPSRGFISEVVRDVADTVVDAVEMGHSLMHRPYVRQSYVQHSSPGYVRQVVRVPGRVALVHRGCRH